MSAAMDAARAIFRPTNRDAVEQVAELIEALKHTADALEAELKVIGAADDETDEAMLIDWFDEDYARQIIAARMRLGQARAALARSTPSTTTGESA